MDNLENIEKNIVTNLENTQKNIVTNLENTQKNIVTNLENTEKNIVTNLENTKKNINNNLSGESKYNCTIYIDSTKTKNYVADNFESYIYAYAREMVNYKDQKNKCIEASMWLTLYSGRSKYWFTNFWLANFGGSYSSTDESSAIWYLYQHQVVSKMLKDNSLSSEFLECAKAYQKGINDGFDLVSDEIKNVYPFMEHIKLETACIILSGHQLTATGFPASPLNSDLSGASDTITDKMGSTGLLLGKDILDQSEGEFLSCGTGTGHWYCGGAFEVEFSNLSIPSENINNGRLNSLMTMVLCPFLPSMTCLGNDTLSDIWPTYGYAGGQGIMYVKVDSASGKYYSGSNLLSFRKETVDFTHRTDDGKQTVPTETETVEKYLYFTEHGLVVSLTDPDTGKSVFEQDGVAKVWALGERRTAKLLEQELTYTRKFLSNSIKSLKQHDEYVYTNTATVGDVFNSNFAAADGTVQSRSTGIQIQPSVKAIENTENNLYHISGDYTSTVSKEIRNCYCKKDRQMPFDASDSSFSIDRDLEKLIPESGDSNMSAMRGPIVSDYSGTGNGVARHEHWSRSENSGPNSLFMSGGGNHNNMETLYTDLIGTIDGKENLLESMRVNKPEVYRLVMRQWHENFPMHQKPIWNAYKIKDLQGQLNINQTTGKVTLLPEPTKKVSRLEADELAHDYQSFNAQKMKGPLLAALSGVTTVTIEIDGESKEVDITPAKTALENWDNTFSYDATGAHVWHCLMSYLVPLSDTLRIAKYKETVSKNSLTKTNAEHYEGLLNVYGYNAQAVYNLSEHKASVTDILPNVDFVNQTFTHLTDEQQKQIYDAHLLRCWGFKAGDLGLDNVGTTGVELASQAMALTVNAISQMDDVLTLHTINEDQSLNKFTDVATTALEKCSRKWAHVHPVRMPGDLDENGEQISHAMPGNPDNLTGGGIIVLRTDNGYYSNIAFSGVKDENGVSPVAKANTGELIYQPSAHMAKNSYRLSKLGYDVSRFAGDMCLQNIQFRDNQKVTKYKVVWGGLGGTQFDKSTLHHYQNSSWPEPLNKSNETDKLDILREY